MLGLGLLGLIPPSATLIEWEAFRDFSWFDWVLWIPLEVAPLPIAAALTLTPEQRRWPRWIPVAGLVGCVVLTLALPWRELLSGAGVLLVGAAVRWIVARRGVRQA